LQRMGVATAFPPDYTAVFAPWGRRNGHALPSVGEARRVGVLIGAAGAAAAAAETPLKVAGQPASILPNLNRLTDAEKAAGWKLLFDGTTTAGWRNFGKQTISAGWQVLDGELCRVDKTAGDIITTGEFDNFVLELDYKVPPHANSGIMFRVSEDEKRAPSPASNTRSSTTPIPRAIRKSRAGPTPCIIRPPTPKPASRWTLRYPSDSGTTSSWCATGRTSSTG